MMPATNNFYPLVYLSTISFSSALTRPLHTKLIPTCMSNQKLGLRGCSLGPKSSYLPRARTNVAIQRAFHSYGKSLMSSQGSMRSFRNLVELSQTSPSSPSSSPSSSSFSTIVDEDFDQLLVRDDSSSSIVNRSYGPENVEETMTVEDDKMGERALGILVLLTVPLAWGTYTPVVKYMYDKMNPSMPGFFFSAGYYIIAALSLSYLSFWRDQKQQTDITLPRGTDQKDQLSGGEIVYDDVQMTNRGGWELGSYLFIGNGLQVIGLQTVPADRAAFLVQLTTVMVPLFSALFAGKFSAVPLKTWAACLIAFIGVIIMGADDGQADKSKTIGDTVDSFSGNKMITDDYGSENIEGTLSTLLDSKPFGPSDMNNLFSSLQLSNGDIFIILAAVAYTMHVIRLGSYAPRTRPIKLAATKATTEACLSIALVSGLVLVGYSDISLPSFASKVAIEVQDYFKIISSVLVNGGWKTIEDVNSLVVSIIAILWTGWVTCAYTIYAQSFGQKRVNPTDSNLIYTTQPLFSSLFAFVLLGETLGFYGCVGALLIGTALWLVSFPEKKSN